MVKVTLNQPAAALPAADVVVAPDQFNVTDSIGRTLTLKKPGVLAQFRLVEALGDSAKNEVYMGMVMPLLFLSAIDGDPVPAPAKKVEVEALIKRLDEPGIQALMLSIPKHFGGEEQEDAVKKLDE